MAFRTKLGFFSAACLYTITSYILLLRDGNFIVRLAFALHNQDMVENTNRLSATIDRYLIHPNSLSLLLFTIASLSLVWFYLRLICAKPKLFTRQDLLFYTLTVIVIFLSFPSLSSDVFDYHATNQIVFVHHANPWQTPPLTFLDQDPLVNLGSWINRPSIYPPITFAVYAVSYFIFGSHPLISLIGYKLTATLFFFLIVYLCGRLAPSYHLNPTKTRLLLATNPLLLLEFIGNAHNDLVMVFFFVLSLYFFSQKRHTISALSFGISFLSKITIVVYWPVLVNRLLRQSPLSTLLKYSLTTLICVSFGLALMDPAVTNYLQVVVDQNQTHLQSFPYLIKIITDPISAHFPPLHLASFLPLVLFALTYLKIITSRLKLTDQLAAVMLAFLFVQITMLHPWYFAWILPLTPFIRQPKLRWLVLATTASGFARYLAYDLSLYYQPLAPSWQIIIYAFMAAPLLFLLVLPNKWYTKIRFFKSLSCSKS